MRITGGTLRGRTLRAPRGDRVRPTSDRVREALFAMLVTEIAGASFLDLYAGSGVVGLEAVSRGAAPVVWVEGDREVVRTTRANVAKLAGVGARVVSATIEEWLPRGGAGSRFEIAFADPPYAETRNEGLAAVAAALREHDVVVVGGLFAAEMPRSSPVAVWPGWRILRDRHYGSTRVVIGQRKS